MDQTYIEDLELARKLAKRQAEHRGQGRTITQAGFPNVEDLPLDAQAPVAKLRDEFDQLQRRHRAIRDELVGMPQKIRLAQDADTRAAAAAMRSGEPASDLTRPAVAAHEAQLRQEKATIEVALQSVAADLAKLVDAQGAAWALELEGRIPAVRQAGQMAVDEMRESMQRLGRHKLLIAWLRRGGDGELRPGTGSIRVEGLDLSLSSILDGLATLFDEPQPKPFRGRDPESQELAEAMGQVLNNRRNAG